MAVLAAWVHTSDCATWLRLAVMSLPTAAVLSWTTAAVCGYEVVALSVRRIRGREIPTVSELAWRHPALCGALLALAVKHAVWDNPYRRRPWT